MVSRKAAIATHQRRQAAHRKLRAKLSRAARTVAQIRERQAREREEEKDWEAKAHSSLLESFHHLPKEIVFLIVPYMDYDSIRRACNWGKIPAEWMNVTLPPIFFKPDSVAQYADETADAAGRRLGRGPIQVE